MLKTSLITILAISGGGTVVATGLAGPGLQGWVAIIGVTMTLTGAGITVLWNTARQQQSLLSQGQETARVVDELKDDFVRENEHVHGKLNSLRDDVADMRGDVQAIRTRCEERVGRCSTPSTRKGG